MAFGCVWSDALLVVGVASSVKLILFLSRRFGQMSFK